MFLITLNMIVLIRPTVFSDMPAVMQVYDIARRFMQKTGNLNQWVDGYPAEELIKEDIQKKQSFVCLNEEEEIVGVFCYIEGEDDPTYLKIYNGDWLNNEPYGVIHRIASSGKEKGVAEACLGWAFTRFKNIRIDTHRDNVVMQNILKKFDFKYCGVIYLRNGAERLAFQKRT